ncbi:hypothetical protein GGI04_000343 [Coemansia thaxteri]|uniref:G-protein coupled receptors family 3 profile domain-containing protein n=1 Tax=Coemansia thaxteri TaxID=2663907 RepID=A0A9W8EHJ6_9FUNG|nr:hypothetical protein H4R26_000399 [Coemansia thaxteri]KAJ2009544.1 hypothetical protein GGI04_000343 [Coemansia thaxteri]KAJ2474441.1 hypothetical protein GGI02_000063 [Coemansia sp. RSA 2322]KAJ2487719.1 hypothetical protein EV174_000390 [Coemansia sp. RSA 2320]
MSFSYTAAEQNRVNMATMLGYHLDPISYKDMGLIIAISILYGIDLLAVVFMLWNRNYPPIKSKGPLLMAAAYVSCVCWFIGDLQINGHIHLAESGLTNCRGIGVWVRVLLGVCTVSSLIALRSYGLYRVFRLNRPYRGLGLYLPFLVYCVCTLIYGIITQVLSPSVTVEYMPLLDLCYCPKPFRAALYAYIWLTWLFVATINWHIRGIKSSFNESKEMAFSCLGVFAILTFSTALQFSQPNYPFNQAERLLTTAMDHIGTNLVWWAIMGVPIYNCVFRKRQYLEYWTNKLRKDGLQHEYEIGSASGNSVSNNLTCDEDEEIFFFHNANPATPAPVYLPNGEPRPPSRKQQAAFAPNRHSANGAAKHPIRKLQQQLEQRQRQQRRRSRPDTPMPVIIVPKAVNYGDPFDIPPASPTTAVNSPNSNDPFQRLSSSFRPTSQGYMPDTNYAEHGVPAIALADESQVVLPPFSPDESLADISEHSAACIPARRWSNSSSTDDDEYHDCDPHAPTRVPTNNRRIL